MPGTGGGAIPDLGRSDPAILANIEAIVLKGAYVSQGMPSFGHVLDEDDTEALKAFIAFNVTNLKAKKSRAEFMGGIARAQSLTISLLLAMRSLTELARSSQ